mmetsp:Transcript_41714/g.111223  ORF Transcript_41714/g.111223 Transcript_41714/m.111223 type:complete len:105 (-) Transcript_41714:5-319(-)
MIGRGSGGTHGCTASGAAKATSSGDGVRRARLATGAIALPPLGWWFLVVGGAVAHEFLPAADGVITRVSRWWPPRFEPHGSCTSAASTGGAPRGGWRRGERAVW